MRPIFYEMRKTATNWKFVLIVGLLVLFTALIIYSSARPVTAGGGFVNDNSAVFYNNGTYYADSYVYNGYGAPVKNANVGVSLVSFGAIGTSTTIKNWTLTSGSNGFANFTFPESTAPQNSSKTISYTLMFNISSPGASQFGSSYSVASLPNAYNQQKSQYFLSSVVNKNNPYIPNLMIQYLSYNHSMSPPVSLYYYYPGNLGYPVFSAINSSWVNAGNYSSFTSIIVQPNFNANQSYVDVALTYRGSNLTIGSTLVQYTSPSASIFENAYFSGVSTLAVFMMSIGGVVGGYVAFGKDKATGVLDNVLARPIKRSNIILSRYAASGSIVVIMSLVLGAVDYFIIALLYGIYLPLGFLLAISGGLAVTSLAFLGLTFLFSNITRSTGTIIALSILLLVFYIFAWQLVELILPLSFGLFPGSREFASMELVLSYLSPYNFSSLAYSLTNSSYSGGFGVSYLSVGLNWVTLTIYGALWILVPIGLAHYLYKNRD